MKYKQLLIIVVSVIFLIIYSYLDSQKTKESIKQTIDTTKIKQDSLTVDKDFKL